MVRFGRQLRDDMTFAECLGLPIVACVEGEGASVRAGTLKGSDADIKQRTLPAQTIGSVL